MKTKTKRRIVACVAYALLIALKLIGIINWPWLVVLAPLIAFGALIVIALTIGLSICISDFFFD